MRRLPPLPLHVSACAGLASIWCPSVARTVRKTALRWPGPKAEPVPAKKSGHSFGEAIAAVALAESVNWKPQKEAIAKWISPVKRYCTTLVSKDVTQVTEQHVIDCLAPHWLTNHQTALRTLGRVVTIMGYARREGWIAADNPVNARGARCGR